MKIYDIGKDTARRLKLIDDELMIAHETGYLFVCNDKDVTLIWKYVGEAVARGIEVFQSVSKDLITKVDERGATTLKFPLFTFVVINPDDVVWMRDVIKEILRGEEESHNEEEKK